MAIKHFSDHAANERTFLAWLRSSIAMMAFGFLVERFDLLLAFAERAVAKGTNVNSRSEFGHIAGLALILLGIAMIFLSAVRFARNARQIDDDAVHPGTGAKLDLALAALLILLCAGLLLYLAHVITAQA